MATGDTDTRALWDEVAKEREAGSDAALKTEDDVKPQDDEFESEVDEQVEAKADDKPADTEKKEEPDPYEGLSPALKARLEKIDTLEQQVSQIPQLIQHVKTADGRVAAMQREMDVAKNAAKAANTAPTAAQIAAASGSLEKWDSLKTDFPEWADATEQFVKASLADIKPQQTQGLDPKQVEDLVEQRMQAMRAETTKVVEEAKVEGKHPNWRDDINTDAFVQWFGKQPPEVKALADSVKGRDAIRMLDLFHESKAKPVETVKADRANKLAAAVSSKPGAVAVTTTKTVDDMSPSELWEYERKRAAKKNVASGRYY